MTSSVFNLIKVVLKLMKMSIINMRSTQRLKTSSGVTLRKLQSPFVFSSSSSSLSFCRGIRKATEKGISIAVNMTSASIIQSHTALNSESCRIVQAWSWAWGREFELGLRDITCKRRQNKTSRDL